MACAARAISNVCREECGRPSRIVRVETVGLAQRRGEVAEWLHLNLRLQRGLCSVARPRRACRLLCVQVRDLDGQRVVGQLAGEQSRQGRFSRAALLRHHADDVSHVIIGPWNPVDQATPLPVTRFPCCVEVPSGGAVPRPGRGSRGAVGRFQVGENRSL